MLENDSEKLHDIDNIRVDKVFNNSFSIVKNSIVHTSPYPIPNIIRQKNSNNLSTIIKILRNKTIFSI
jgi:hypothetical protein